jgi:hypothetical protein
VKALLEHRQRRRLFTARRKPSELFLAKGHGSWKELLVAGDYREFLLEHAGRIIARNAFRSVAIFDWEGDRYFFKWHHKPPYLGLHEWTLSNYAQVLGIPVATPVGAGSFPSTGQSFFISQELSGAQSLESFLDREQIAQRGVPRKILEELASLVAKLHRYKLVHKDLYLGHFFWHPQEETLSLIDWARARHKGFPFVRWRLKDLASLHFSASLFGLSREDKVRFYLLYRGLETLRWFDIILMGLIVTKSRCIARHTLRVLRRCTELREATAHNSIERVAGCL